MAPAQPSVSAGRISVGGAAARSTTYAIFDAIGVRIRRVPFTPARIRAAIET